MIAYSLYQKTKSKKEQDPTGNTATQGSPQQAVGGPAMQRPMPLVPTQALNTHQQPISCPLCAKERAVQYMVREQDRAVFASCLTCETSWKT